MTLIDKLQIKNYKQYSNDPNIYSEISEWLTENTDIDVRGLSKSAMVWLIRNNYKDNPKCKVCGIPLKYVHKKGYKTYCSSRCVSKCANVRLKTKKTNTLRYGSPYIVETDFFEEKSKKTCLDNYGKEYFLQTKLCRTITNSKSFKRTYDSLLRRSKDVSILTTESNFFGSGRHKIYEWRCNRCECQFSHWYSSGKIPTCPICNLTKGPNEIRKYLDEHDVRYTLEKIFDDCRDVRPLPFDFYLPDKNILIEFDGGQHFFPKDHFGGIEAFEIRIKHDNIKNEYAINNNIKIIRIPHWEYENIIDILRVELI